MVWTRQVWPVTLIDRDLKSGEYRVQPYTEGPVATTAFGEPMIIAPENFHAKIAHAVIANLEKFGKEKYEQRRATRHSPSEQREYLKRHVGVSVRKDPAGRLIIRPLHHERGGSVGVDEDAITLSAEDVPQKLAAAIAEAFRRAT